MSTVDAGISEDVLSLVQTVKRLDSDDQERILRMVRLLTLAPPRVRDNTHVMLRELLDHNSSTMIECITAVDQVIQYLESSAGPFVADQWVTQLDSATGSSRHN